MVCIATAGVSPRIARGSTGPSDTARTGDTLPAALGSARFIQPSCVRLAAGRAGFHVVLRVEVRARRVGRTDRIDNRQMLLVEQRLERRERGMQSEEAVQVDRGVVVLAWVAGGPRDRDGRAQVVVGLLAVRHHDVQAVGRAALEDRDQNFLARAGASAAYKARSSHSGAAPTPTMARAEFVGRIGESACLPLLKLRRTQRDARPARTRPP